MIRQHFRAVFSEVLSQLAIFSQLGQYYAVLEQSFNSTVMNKLKMIRNDLNY